LPQIQIILDRYARRTRNNDAHLDGVAIFFRSNELKCDYYEEVPFFCNSYLDRDNVGQIAVFQWNPSQNEDASVHFVVANTHILFNPNRGFIKVGQTHVLLTHIMRFFQTPSNLSQSINGGNPLGIPVLFCGDMNSAPDSPIHNFITQGWIDLKQNERFLADTIPQLESTKSTNLKKGEPDVSESLLGPSLLSRLNFEENIQANSTRLPRYVVHPFQFHSVYSGEMANNHASTCHSRHSGVVDAIFYGNLAPLDFNQFPAYWDIPLGGDEHIVQNALQKTFPPNRDTCIRMIPLQILGLPMKDTCLPAPNASEGSDHFSLLVDFAVVKLKCDSGIQ
jgi:hypothetical protein